MIVITTIALICVLSCVSWDAKEEDEEDGQQLPKSVNVQDLQEVDEEEGEEEGDIESHTLATTTMSSPAVAVTTTGSSLAPQLTTTESTLIDTITLMTTTAATSDQQVTTTAVAVDSVHIHSFTFIILSFTTSWTK